MPEILAVHDNVEVPDPPEIEVDDRVQLRLVEFVATDRVTVEVSPLRGATLIVEVPATPTATVTLVGFEDNEKSAAGVTRYVTCAECDRVPLVPVTVAR